MKARRVKDKDKELLEAFERLCLHYGVVSRGFHPEDITYPAMGPLHDGSTQWAMRHTKGWGWMIVSGANGWGCQFGGMGGGMGGHIRGRRNFLSFIEGLTWASVKLTRRAFMNASPIPGLDSEDRFQEP